MNRSGRPAIAIAALGAACAAAMLSTAAAQAAPRVSDPAPVPGRLYGAAARSAVSAWAVGLDTKPLILHWNGRSWHPAPVPAPAGVRTTLTSVSAVSATDIWAVGNKNLSGANAGFVVHWNGRSWARSPHPTPAPGAVYNGVAAVSARDVWAVGDTQYRGACPGTCATVIEHWNGRAWSIVPSPNAPDSTVNVVLGVAANSAASAWAVGSVDWARTLMLRWNGRTWRIW